MLNPTNCRGRTQLSRKMRRSGIIAVLLCRCLCAAQINAAEIPGAEQVRQLTAEQRWQEVVRLLGPLPSRSADFDFYYGTALARLERWQESQNAFQAGLRASANDPRFPVELAGFAFKKRQYPQAPRLFAHALKLAPHASHARD